MSAGGPDLFDILVWGVVIVIVIWGFSKEATVRAALEQALTDARRAADDQRANVRRIVDDELANARRVADEELANARRVVSAQVAEARRVAGVEAAAVEQRHRETVARLRADAATAAERYAAEIRDLHEQLDVARAYRIALHEYVERRRTGWQPPRVEPQETIGEDLAAHLCRAVVLLEELETIALKGNR